MSSIWRRGKRGFFWIGYTKDGIKYEYSLRLKDERLARIRQKQIDLENEQSIAKVPSSKRLSDVLEEYYRDSRLRKAKKSLDTDIPQLKRFLAFTGDIPIRNIKQATINAFIHHLASTKYNKKDNYSAKSINNYLINIKAFFNWSRNYGYIIENPAGLIKRLPIHHEAPRYLAPEEILRLVEHAKKSALYPLVMFLLYTGCRVSEALTLLWSDVDLEGGGLTIRGLKSKTKKFRIIPIHPVLAKILASRPRTSKHVFTNNSKFKKVSGKPYIKPPTDEFRAILKNAKIDFDKGKAFHVLRHNFVSWLIMNGVDIYTAAMMAGHSSVEMTKRYAHLSPEYLKNKINSLTFLLQSENKEGKK